MNQVSCYAISGLMRLFPAVAFILINLSAFAQVKTDTLIYTVKPGDYLIKISERLGSKSFWNDLYEANADLIQNSNLIYPGQKLVIPITVQQSEKFVNIFEAKPTASAKDSLKQLDEFRRAFEALVAQKSKQKTKNKDPELMEMGLVINDTRSKMGMDFYNIFYKNWNAPENSGNFILTILEQPTPSLGTIISIKINHEQVFQAKLQPRYEIIESLAERAIIICYQNLYQQTVTSSQLIGY